MNWKSIFKGATKFALESDVPDKILESKGVPGFVIDAVEDRLLKKLNEPEKPQIFKKVEREKTMALEVKPLSDIYAFPYYSTRSEFEKVTGEVCPPFNINKPSKYWRDLSIKDSSKKLFEYFNTLKVSENGTLLFANGVPEFDSIVLTKADAMSVNIPEKVEGGNIVSNLPTLPEVQVPLDFTKIPSSYSIKVRFGGTVALVSGVDAPESSSGFTTEDRRVQGEILGKVNAIAERLKNL